MLNRADKLRRATTDEERRALAMPRRQELERSEPGAFLTPAEARGHHSRVSCDRGIAGPQCQYYTWR